MLARITQRAEREMILAWKGARHSWSSPTASRRRVFVAGMQRSGTNMMMDLLERSLDTDVYHERDRRAFDNYQMRERATIQRLSEHSQADCFVIKALCELQQLSGLMADFAPARVVWLVRRYEDVVNSMQVSFRNMAKQAKRIAAGADPGVSGWLGEGMSAATHAHVRRVAHEDLSDASGAALQWYFRNVLAFDQGLHEHPDALFVGYEKLVADPERMTSRIFDFLELDHSSRITRWVHSRSVGRREPPVVDEPIRELCEALTQRMQPLVERDAG